MFNKKENACPCAYCEYFKLVEDNSDYFIIQKGICRKHNIPRELYDELCEEFVLMKGIHTKKWYPSGKAFSKSVN